MRLPTRRSQKLKIQEDEGPLYMTQEGVDRMKLTLKDMEDNLLPQAIADTSRTGEFGDFSENAEYKEAKYRMRRLHSRIFSIKEKLKRVQIIEKGVSDKVGLGSKVEVEVDGEKKVFNIVGPQEANPMKGRLSYRSPLGVLLMGRMVGEVVEVGGKDKKVKYTISAID